jgi:hypothetical protein
VRAILRQLTGQRERRAASKALREALERIHRALVRNPDLSPFGPLPAQRRAPGAPAGRVAGLQPSGRAPASPGKRLWAARRRLLPSGSARSRSPR